ncbi:hypothetical protein Aperf_G00000037653 [Anoplocephala perfoliata]
MTQTQASRINALSNILSSSTASTPPPTGTNGEGDVLRFPHDTPNGIADAVKNSATDAGGVISFPPGDCSRETANDRETAQNILIRSHTMGLKMTEFREGNCSSNPAKRKKTSTANITSRFLCNLCNSAYDTLAELHFHTVQTHGKYGCHLCKSTFSKRPSLIQHILKHSEVMPFQCDLCGATAHRKDYLIRHIRQWHQECLIPKEHIRQLHCVRKLVEPLLRKITEDNLSRSNHQPVESDILGHHPGNSFTFVETSKVHKAPETKKEKIWSEQTEGS